MTTLQTTRLRFIQHLESIEVVYRHSDLPSAFAQVIVSLPKDAAGNFKSGDELQASIASQAPPREWFVAQNAKLNAETAAMQALPAELQELAPIKQLHAQLNWFEDAVVQPARVVEGEWVRPAVAVDLRSPQNLATLKQRLAAELARVRYEHETGGVIVNGATVLTDRESQATIIGAYARANADAGATVQWKAANGFVTLDAAAIMQFGNAVFNHVQSCFAREGVLREQIDLAGSVHALMQIDIAAGWGG